MGVFRQPARVRPHAGVRDLSWRQPGPVPGLPNVSVVGSLTFTGYSLITGTTAQIGDTLVASNTTPGNYVVVVNPDGTFDILDGGDNSRQRINFGLYHRITGILETGGIFWVNEVAPVWNAPVTLLGLAVGVPIAPRNLALPAYTSSASGDALTFTLASGSLGGLSLATNGMLTGTPPLVGTFNPRINITDSTGTPTLSPLGTITVIAVGPPPPPPPTPSNTCVNAWSADGRLSVTADGFPGWSADGYEPTALECAVEGLAAAGVNVGPLTYQYSLNGTPLGYVVTGWPYLAESLPPGSYAPLVISNGPPPPSGPVNPPSVIGQYYYDAQLQILQAGLRTNTPNFVLNPAVQPGIVFEQSLPPNVAVPAETQMTITVSGFPVVIQPNTIVPVP